MSQHRADKVLDGHQARHTTLPVLDRQVTKTTLIHDFQTLASSVAHVGKLNILGHDRADGGVTRIAPFHSNLVEVIALAEDAR